MARSQRQTRKPKLKAKVIARDANQGILFLGFLILLASFIISNKLSASATSTIDLRNLERNIWTSPDHEIPDLQSTATRLIQHHPDSSFAHYLLGQLYIRQFISSPYEMHLLRQAAELGQQAIDLKPSKDFGYIIAGQVLDMMGYTSNGIKLVDPKINSKIEATWRTEFLLAKFRSAGSGYDSTINSLSNALALKNAQTSVIIPYVLALIESNHSEESLIKELRKWNKKIESEAINLNLAIALSSQKQYKAAHKEYQKIQRRFPNSIEASINDSIILYRHLNNFELARKQLANSLKKKPHLSDEQVAIVKSHLARIHLEKKEYKNAESMFLNVILTMDNSLDWVTLSHEAYRELNLHRQFSKLMKRVKLEVPGTGSIYALHGEVLSENLQEFGAAEKSYQDAILLDPHRSEYYTGLGLTYYRQKNMEQALDLFVQATLIDPNDATARYNEACVLSLLGRSQEALGSLKEAINLDPRLQGTASQDTDFQNINDLDQFKDMVGFGQNYSELTIPPPINH